MREIKFRAWLKKEATPFMAEVKSLHLGTKKAIIGYSKSRTQYGNYSVKFDDIELMQYIDLKDMNGIEIYEGDIVHIIYDCKEFIYQIVWDNEELDFKATNGKEDYGSNFQYLGCADEIEVIGNIYESKELLGGN